MNNYVFEANFQPFLFSESRSDLVVQRSQYYRSKALAVIYRRLGFRHVLFSYFSDFAICCVLRRMKCLISSTSRKVKLLGLFLLNRKAIRKLPAVKKMGSIAFNVPLFVKQKSNKN